MFYQVKYNFSETKLLKNPEILQKFPSIFSVHPKFPKNVSPSLYTQGPRNLSYIFESFNSFFYPQKFRVRNWQKKSIDLRVEAAFKKGIFTANYFSLNI